MYILGLLFCNYDLGLIRLHFHVESYLIPNQNKENIT